MTLSRCAPSTKADPELPIGPNRPIFCSMPEQTNRDRIIEAGHSLPPDATFDDAIERLVFLARVEEGLAELDAGHGIPHDDVKWRLGL